MSRPGVQQREDPVLMWGAVLSALLPFLLYLRTLSGASYWLDAGEFVSAAVELDIAHPPGHPLTALYCKAWSLFPLGSIAFRVALGQAAAAALAAGLLFRACAITAEALGVRAARLVLPIGLLGAWLWALSYAVWFQAVRPEVYALQALVLMFAIERLARFASAAREDPRPLYAASFAVALGMTNHHVMAFFLLPALAVAVARQMRRRGSRALWVCAGIGLLGLAVYAYLPLRAARQPPANLGDPVTLANFVWVLSARVYTRGVGSSSSSDLFGRYADSAVVIAEQFYGVFLIAALLGLYAGLRNPASRPLCVLWSLVAAPVCLLRPLLTDTVRGNPDAIAYLMPGLAALAALASAGVAAPLALVTGWSRWTMRVCLWSGLAWLVIAPWLRPGPPVDLSRFHAPDSFDEQRVRRLPPRAVLLATTPQTVFRHWELAATERLRPDVLLLPVPFLNYPGFAGAVARRHPELAELTARFVADDRLDPAAMARLAARRPVLVELDQHTASAAYPALAPQHLLYAQLGSPASDSRLDANAARQRALYHRIETDLGADVHEAETARQLLWLHYMDALFYAAQGRRDDARDAVARAKLLFPAETRLAALSSALNAPATGDPRVDVRPFLSLNDAAP